MPDGLTRPERHKPERDPARKDGTATAAQQASADLKNAYERGEDIPLTDVVLSMQKASIGFEATLQVRNKLLKAYEDIKNMPV